MDREYEHVVSWSNGSADGSFVAVHIEVQNRTGWRLEHRIDGLIENQTVWWKYTELIRDHNSHYVTNASSGSTNSFPVCTLKEGGSVNIGCEPVSVRENIGGASAGTTDPGVFVYFSAMFGAVDGRIQRIEIHSDEPVEVLEGQVGESELIVIDEGTPGVDSNGNSTYANASVEYHADAPILGAFRGIRASFESFSATHESGLSFRYERGPPQEDEVVRSDGVSGHDPPLGRWYMEGEPVKARMFSGPPGDWVFHAQGQRAENRVSSPVVGLLIDPFFVDEEGAMIPLGPT